MQNFSHLLQGKHFQIGDWMKDGKKKVRFPTENWLGYISETVRYTTQITINH